MDFDLFNRQRQARKLAVRHERFLPFCVIVKKINQRTRAVENDHGCKLTYCTDNDRLASHVSQNESNEHRSRCEPDGDGLMGTGDPEIHQRQTTPHMRHRRDTKNEREPGNTSQCRGERKRAQKLCFLVCSFVGSFVEGILLFRFRSLASVNAERESE